MKISLFLLVAISAVVVYAGKHHKDDQNWKDHSGKHKLKFKDDDDEAGAYANYLEADRIINEHNAGDQSFKIEHNEFSHMNKNELKKRRGHKKPKAIKNNSRKRAISGTLTPTAGGYYYPAKTGLFSGYFYSATSGYSAPTSLNWVTKGFNKPVLNQMNCGSCWAFSTTAGMEASLYANNRTNVTLSPQELVSCDTYDGGCDGGNVISAYMFANQKGITQAANYPYTSSINYSLGVSGTCNTAKASIAPLYKPKTFYLHQDGDDKAVIEMLNKFGPLSIAIDASADAFQYYKSGIYALTAGYCDPNYINHAMLLVGYGVSGTTPYWLIKNQYGLSWGQSGYMMLARNIPNNCGISTAASVPIF